VFIDNTSPDDTHTIWVTEVWDDEEHHAASLSVEGAAGFIRETMPPIAGRLQQIRLVPVGGKELAR